MGHHKSSNWSNSYKSVQFKRSVLAMCVMALSASAFAQDTPKKDEAVDEVIITGHGMKDALGDAQQNKRNADTVIESITAKDLGSFPDKSVAEALQRVAGITVNRFAASSDTAHFSAEPSGVIVRGLNQVRTEFNGHDSFSANSARGLSWGDISPELMSGVDTYKNQTAELIEGGIAGTVNMRTRVPFDQANDMYALSVQGNYGNLSGKTTPEVSGLISHRWSTGVGEFGILGNLAYSNVNTRSEGVQFGRLDRFKAGSVAGTTVETYFPDTINFRDDVYDRTRKGGSLAAQWKDDESKYTVTLQVNRSEYNNTMEEYVVAPGLGNPAYSKSVYSTVDDSGKFPVAAAGTPALTFDDTGFFRTGTLNQPEGYWADSGALKNDAGKQFIASCQSWSSCSNKNFGLILGDTTRYSQNENVTQDVSVNFKWEPSDTIHANFDIQRVSSSVKNYDISTENDSFTNPTIDLTGSVPKVFFGEPTNVAMSSGAYTNPHNFYLGNIMDHVEDSSGHELAVRADIKIDVDSGWIHSVKAGVRYADREQQVNWSQYNWQGVSNSYTSNASDYFLLDSKASTTSSFKGYPDFYATKKWTSTFGSLGTYGGDNTFLFANMDLLKNQKAWASAMSSTALGLKNGAGWDPICSNTGDRAGEIAGTCFTPAETVDISEKTKAFYVQLNFGGDELNLFGKPLSGNLGVRYVETEDVSNGGKSIPLLGADDLKDELIKPDSNNTPIPVPYTVGHYLSAADKAYMNGASILTTTDITHRNLLPSLNFKWDLDEEWLLRLALSRAMARPDIGNLRNYIGVTKTLPSVSSADDPLWIKDSSGTIIGANVAYKADAQNPLLKPILADQVDLSLEYYFAKVGSFTVTAFAKQFQDYIQIGKYNTDVTNNGVTRSVEVRAPLNGDGAKISGFELAFQRFFDFMPAPYDGLGVQANYTYVENKGIANTNVTSTGAGSSTVSGQAPDAIQVDTLEGLSKNAYNFVLMYEKDAIAARIAYNWRSAYMITAVDCCVAVPIWNAAYGQLDASIKYKFSDNLTVALQASNLLNEKTKLTQQIEDSSAGGQKMPNAWFQNDVRYTLGLRLTY